MSHDGSMINATPIKPKPIRPFTQSNTSSEDVRQTSGQWLRSRSSADLNGLSRTSSFLSLSGLAERSSALFGIFEQGGFETEPPTPDTNLNRQYNLNTNNAPSTGRSNDTSSAGPKPFFCGRDAVVAGVIAACSYTFLVLFHNLPNKNRFFIAAGAQQVKPAYYCAAVTISAVLFNAARKLTRPAYNVDRRRDSTVTTSGDDDSRPSTSQQDKSGNASRGEFNLIVRWFAGFLGLAYAATKLDYTNALQFNGCVAAVALGALLVADRSLRGFAISLVLAGLGTVIHATATGVRDPADLPSIAVLVWLNVAVYGCLGKAIGLMRA
ncbi:hypothetical protein PYCC9005_004868 [Savitreella phatthalungensis]